MNEPLPAIVSDRARAMMLNLWRAGRNTQEIAVALHLPEWEVANWLPVLRERARRMNARASR